MCQDCHVVLQVQWSAPNDPVSGPERLPQVTSANKTSTRRAISGAGLAGSGLPSKENSDPAAPDGLAKYHQSWQSEAPAPLVAGQTTDNWSGTQPGSIDAETRAQSEQSRETRQTRQALAVASKTVSAGPGPPGRSEEAGAPQRPSSNGSQAQQASDHDGDGNRAGAGSPSAVLGTTTKSAADAADLDLESFESLLSAGKELFRQVHTLCMHRAWLCT